MLRRGLLRSGSAATHLRNNSRDVRTCVLTCARAMWLDCVTTRHVLSARGARALLEPSDVPRSARQDEQREGAGDRRTEITTPRAWMCGLADLDADRKARSDGRRDDHEGQLTNRGGEPRRPGPWEAMRWAGNPWTLDLVRDPLSCQWSGQRRSVVFVSKDTKGGFVESARSRRVHLGETDVTRTTRLGAR